MSITIKPVRFTENGFKTATGKYVCSVCGYVYDPAEHDGPELKRRARTHLGKFSKRKVCYYQRVS